MAGWCGTPFAARGSRRDRCRATRRPIATLSPFAACIIAITVLAALGLPIGHAMIAASILYLLLAGLDLEQRPSSCSMASSTATCCSRSRSSSWRPTSECRQPHLDRLLGFCLVLAGHPAAAWSRQCRCEHHFRRHVRIRHCGRRRHRPHHHRDDDQRGGDIRSPTRERSPLRPRSSANHPAVDPDGSLRADLGCLDRLSSSAAWFQASSSASPSWS